MENFNPIGNSFISKKEKPEEEKIADEEGEATGEETMEELCAWCGKKMGVKKSRESGITHGICPECSEKVREEINIRKTDIR